LDEVSISSGDRRAVGCRFQVLGPYTAKPRWPVNVLVQVIRRAPETTLITTVCRRSQYTPVGHECRKCGSRDMRCGQTDRHTYRHAHHNETTCRPILNEMLAVSENKPATPGVHVKTQQTGAPGRYLANSSVLERCTTVINIACTVVAD